MASSQALLFFPCALPAEPNVSRFRASRTTSTSGAANITNTRSCGLGSVTRNSQMSSGGGSSRARSAPGTLPDIRTVIRLPRIQRSNMLSTDVCCSKKPIADCPSKAHVQMRLTDKVSGRRQVPPDCSEAAFALRSACPTSQRLTYMSISIRITVFSNLQ